MQIWCKELGLDTRDIHYETSDKCYCKEASDQVSHFFREYSGEFLDPRILHGDGNSFKLNGEYIMEDGSDMVVTLPSGQHGE